MENPYKTYEYINGSNKINFKEEENITELKNEFNKNNNLSKIIQEKDYEILILKKENISLKLDKKHLNNKIIKMNTQIKQLDLKLENINIEIHKKRVSKSNEKKNENNFFLQTELLNLKSKLTEKENQIINNKNEINVLKKNIEKNILNINNNFSNDLIKRDKYINDLHNKLSNYDKDYNNLINYIIEKFSNIEELIENYDINNLTNLNFQKEDDKIFSKYDLINKNFQNLIKRLKEIRINDKENLKKYEEIIKKEKEKNFQLEIKLSEEKTERITERKNILGIDEVIKENSNDIQRLNNTITNIINKTDEYEFEKNNLFKQLIQFKQIINNLCDENIQILFDYINHNFKKDKF